MTITQKKENILLARTELQGELQFEGATPSNAHLIQEIVKECSCDPARVVIKHIHTQFGQNKAHFSALIYNSTEARQKTEKLTKHYKKKLEEEAKKKAEESKKAGEQ